MAMRWIALAGEESVPVLGLGTWGYGEDPGRRGDEVAAVRTGLDLGLNLVDTAEMYADGGAEEVLGEALAGRRDAAFVVSKVLPSHASRSGTIAACERSLQRLGTDRIDLYLLHWQGRHPLEDTLAGFHQLIEDGKIRYWGVSNFDHVALAELRKVPGGGGLATDQVLYNLSRRGPEYDLLPWCADHDLPVMAYSPIEQGRILNNAALREVAAGHGISPAAAALAWVLRRDSLCTIPKASNPEHVRDNATALDAKLTREDLDALDRAFPPPSGPRPLEIL
jgi:diketogulonate reductase-like aldo/keto reductase